MQRLVAKQKARVKAPFLVVLSVRAPICFFLLAHCGLPDGLYYLCLTDSLIRRDQPYAFDDGSGCYQTVCRSFRELMVLPAMAVLTTMGLAGLLRNEGGA
jgi:hypothetical protein